MVCDPIARRRSGDHERRTIPSVITRFTVEERELYEKE